MSEKLPVRGGSSVLFSGNAKITGDLTKSGLFPIPYAMNNITKIDLIEKFGRTVVYQRPLEET